MGQQISWVGLFRIEDCVSECTVVLVKLIIHARHVLLIKSVVFYSGQCDLFLLLLTDTLLHFKALQNFHGTSC